MLIKHITAAIQPIGIDASRIYLRLVKINAIKMEVKCDVILICHNGTYANICKVKWNAYSLFPMQQICRKTI